MKLLLLATTFHKVILLLSTNCCVATEIIYKITIPASYHTVGIEARTGTYGDSDLDTVIELRSNCSYASSAM